MTRSRVTGLPKKSALLFAVMAAIAVSVGATEVAASCARPAVAGENQPVNPARIDQRRLNAAILAEVNYLRCRKRLPQLAAPAKLQKVAANHSKWMARSGRLTHTSNRLGQSTPKQRVVSTGLVKRMGSENIAKVSLYRLDEIGRFRILNASSCQFSTSGGSRISRHTYNSLARYVATLWYKSSSHRSNLMDRRARLTGSGAGFDARGGNCGHIYLTQNFAG